MLGYVHSYHNNHRINCMHMALNMEVANGEQLTGLAAQTVLAAATVLIELTVLMWGGVRG